MSPRRSEDPKTERLFIRIQPKLKSELEAVAEMEKKKISEIVIKAIEEYLKTDHDN